MKMTLYKFVSPALSLLLLLPLPSLVNAQVNPAGQRTWIIDPNTGLPLPSAEVFNLDDSTHGKRINVQFDGLPFPEVVEYLRDQFTNVNFIVTPRVRDFGDTIFLKLHSASLSDILTGIYFATGKKVEYEIQSPKLIAFVSALEKPAESPTPAAPPPPAVKPSMPAQYNVVNLREIWRVKDPARIDQALKTLEEITERTLVELYGAQADKLLPRLNYHSSSGILVIIGQPEALQLVSQVLRNIRIRDEEPANSGPAERPAPPKQPAQPAAPAKSDPTP